MTLDQNSIRFNVTVMVFVAAANIVYFMAVFDVLGVFFEHKRQCCYPKDPEFGHEALHHPRGHLFAKTGGK